MWEKMGENALGARYKTRDFGIVETFQMMGRTSPGVGQAVSGSSGEGDNPRVGVTLHFPTHDRPRRG